MSHFVLVMVEDGKICAPSTRYILIFMTVLFSSFLFDPNHARKEIPAGDHIWGL
jgi:hypothetical protein